MITEKKRANAVGGKTARACESCLKRRARWFCPADDAFLCHACDSSVHMANELASRHTRVRLGTSSSKPPTEPPSWHHGFTKKARTPRNTKAKSSSYCSQMPVVPEVGVDDNEGSLEENDDHMVFSVPCLDPFAKEFNNNDENGIDDDGEFNISLIGFEGDEWDNIPGFLPTENELAEFAADVESLLEKDEAIKAEAEVEAEDEEDGLHVCNFGGVKIEEEGESTTVVDHCYFDWSIDVESEILNFDLNYSNNLVNNSQEVSGGEEEEEKKVVILKGEEEGEESNNKRRKILLRLNYEEVINAWANTQGCTSPWTTGRRPEFNLNHDGWPIYMGDLSHTGFHHHGEDWLGMRGNMNGGDGGREARVSRYREKRRTRLFSKKIRYEVRKLNAEKRPRLKGRFVKRTSLSQGVESSFPYVNK